MPILHVHYRGDASAAQKRELSKRMTDDFVELLGKDPQSVQIFWHRAGDEDFAKGGRLMQDILKDKP